MSTSGFDRAWAVYPRREAKKDALKAWGQAKGDAHVEAILSALEWQRTSESWRRGFVPLFATYLRGERWTDENPTDVKQRVRDADDTVYRERRQRVEAEQDARWRAQREQSKVEP